MSRRLFQIYRHFTAFIFIIHFTPLSSLCKTTHRHWIHINICRVSCGGVVNMLLVLSITFYFHYNIRCCMCSTGPFQYRWLKRYIYNSCYYHDQIGSIHLSHCYHIFPWLCASDVSYVISCHLLPILSGKTENLFSLLLCSLWWVQIVGYVLTCRSYSFVCTVYPSSHYHHCANLSEDFKLIKSLSDIFVECVSKIKHILSIIHYAICGAVCFQINHFSCDDWESIYTLSYYHHQIGSMN